MLVQLFGWLRVCRLVLPRDLVTLGFAIIAGDGQQVVKCHCLEGHTMNLGLLEAMLIVMALYKC